MKYVSLQYQDQDNALIEWDSEDNVPWCVFLTVKGIIKLSIEIKFSAN